MNDQPKLIGLDSETLDMIQTHRYRFYYLFPTGDMIENHFILPRQLSNEQADDLASLYWVRSFEQAIAKGAPTPNGIRKLAGVGKVMDLALARQIVNGSNFEVIRPGEKE